MFLTQPRVKPSIGEVVLNLPIKPRACHYNTSKHGYSGKE